MILKHHLGNDKKRSAGLNEAKIKIISPFPEKVNVSQSNMLSYKYLNTKFSPDVCTSPGLFSPELTVTSLHLLLRSDWAQSHAGNLLWLVMVGVPSSIFSTFLRQNVVWPAGRLVVFVFILRLCYGSQPGSVQLSSDLLLFCTKIGAFSSSEARPGQARPGSRNSESDSRTDLF